MTHSHDNYMVVYVHNAAYVNSISNCHCQQQLAAAEMELKCWVVHIVVPRFMTSTKKDKQMEYLGEIIR